MNGNKKNNIERLQHHPDDYRTIRTVMKKPEEIRKEIDSLYMEYRYENGHEPHYADCVIRWRDDLETEDVRIALAMDSDTEMDEEIFFYCDSINDLKSLADNEKGDFAVAECLGFGIYEELLQAT